MQEMQRFVAAKKTKTKKTPQIHLPPSEWEEESEVYFGTVRKFRMVAKTMAGRYC